MNRDRIMLDLAVEHWKLLRALDRAIERLPPDQARRSAAQHRFSTAKLESLLEEAGLRMVTFEGRAFEPNLPITAVNAAEFAADSVLIVDTTLTPAIMDDMTVRILGTVTVREAEQ